jgi:hypothetical protein
MSRRLKALSGILGVLVVVVVLVATRAGPRRAVSAGPAAEDVSPSQSQPTAAAKVGELIPLREEGPLPNGEKASISEAEKALGSHLYRPEHPLAGDASINAVFLALANDESGPLTRVAVDYQSGVLLLIEPATGPYATDPAAFYEKRLASILQGVAGGVYPEGTTAEIQTVSGVTALVTQNSEGWGDVDLVLGGLHIEIGAGYAQFDADTLVEIANTFA